MLTLKALARKVTTFHAREHYKWWVEFEKIRPFFVCHSWVSATHRFHVWLKQTCRAVIFFKKGGGEKVWEGEVTSLGCALTHSLVTCRPYLTPIRRWWRCSWWCTTWPTCLLTVRRSSASELCTCQSTPTARSRPTWDTSSISGIFKDVLRSPCRFSSFYLHIECATLW